MIPPGVLNIVDGILCAANRIMYAVSIKPIDVGKKQIGGVIFGGSSVVCARSLLSSFADVTPSFLQENGIAALACDIDNTLVTYDDAVPTEAVLHWLEKRLFLREYPLDFFPTIIRSASNDFAEICP